MQTTRGVLVEDVLDQVFVLLQAEDIAHWDRNKEFPGERRTLCSCVLVSHSWRNVALRHLFRDIIFTYGSVVRQNCVNAGHGGCFWCGCSCHWQEGKRVQRELSTFRHFLQDTPHLRQYTRALRIRSSPLLRVEETDKKVDASLLLAILEQLPQLVSLHLEDVILTPLGWPLTSLLPTIPALQQLTLRCHFGYHISATEIVDTLTRFSRIDCLRIIGIDHHNSPSPRPVPPATDLQLDSVTFEDCSFTSGQIFQCMTTAAAGPRSLELTTIRTESVMRDLQTLLTHIREQLVHFGYRVRSVGVPSPLTLFLASAVSDLISGPAVNLVDCTSLQSVDIQLSLHCGVLGSDLRKDVIPMLLSLRAGPWGRLRRITFKSWLIKGLQSHLHDALVRIWLPQLEDVLVQLRETRGIEEIIFRLVDKEDREDVATENCFALQSVLPRLVASGMLQTVILRQNLC